MNFVTPANDNRGNERERDRERKKRKPDTSICPFLIQVEVAFRKP